jgi:uncharacterized protein
VPPWLKLTPDGVELLIRVQPRASRTKVVGEHGGRLKIALAAPPVDGAANEALVEFLAGALKVRKADVTLLDGQTSRQKRLAVRGVDAARALAMMQVG